MGFGVRTNNWRQPVYNVAITLLPGPTAIRRLSRVWHI